MDTITYEYAGFIYYIEMDGDRYRARPVDGQHAAARKDKHCQAAIECWEGDGRPK